MKKPAVVDQAAHAATQAITHPLSTTAYTLGVLRGLGAGLIRLASGAGRGDGVPAGEAPAQRAASPDEASDRATPPPAPRAPQTREPEIVLPQTLAEPAEELAPEPPRESFAHEPTAVSRVSAHGGRGDDAELDDWLADAELDIDPAGDPATGSVIEALERGDGPGDPVDHSAIRSTLSESEQLRRAAE